MGKRTKMTRIFCLLVLISLAFCLQFDVEHTGSPTCFDEDLAYDVLVIGKYQIPQQFGALVELRVTDPTGQAVFKDPQVDDGSFAFTTSAPGIYSICFETRSTATVQQPIRVTLDVKVGVDAEDYDAIAVAEQLNPIEVELRKLEDSATSINRHMNYMRDREAALRNTNESTNSRVLWFSILSLTILVSLGIWQIYHLKKYFESRKFLS